MQDLDSMTVRPRWLIKESKDPIEVAPFEPVYLMPRPRKEIAT